MVSSFRKNILWAISLSGCAFIVSLATQIAISYFYGTSAELDAYWSSLAIINLMVFPVHPFREALVPEIYRRSINDSPEEISTYFSRALTFILLVASMGLILVMIFPQFLSYLVANSAARQLPELVISQLKWFAPVIILLALSETLNSLLVSYHAVILQSVSRLMAAGSSLVIITSLAGIAGIKALVWGFMGAQLVTVTIAIFVIRKHGLRFRFMWPSGLGKAFFSIGAALLVNYSMSQIYSIYEKNIFSGFGEGLISAFQYGVSITNVLITILGLSLANIFWPRFLAHSVNKDIDKASYDMKVVIKAICLGMGLVCTIIFSNAELITHLLFTRGAFDAESAIKTSQALRATIFAAIPISILSILGMAFIAFGAAKKMMLIGVTTAIFGLLILWLSQFFGLYKIAIIHWFLANVISSVLAGILFMHLLGCQLSAYFKVSWWILRMLIIFSGAILTAQLLIDTFFINKISIGVSMITSITILATSVLIGWILGMAKDLKPILGFRKL